MENHKRKQNITHLFDMQTFYSILRMKKKHT